MVNSLPEDGVEPVGLCHLDRVQAWLILRKMFSSLFCSSSCLIARALHTQQSKRAVEADSTSNARISFRSWDDFSGTANSS